MISSAVYPLIRAAPLFQVAIVPLGSSMKMAYSATPSTRRRNRSSLRRNASSWARRWVKSRVTLAKPKSCPPASPRFVLGPPLLPRVVRIKDGKVLPYDLVGSIALESFRAGVPSEHVPIGVQHEDCVVSDAFDEQPKSLFALLQIFFVKASLSCHALQP